MVARKILILFAILGFIAVPAYSQDAYLNTNDGIYRLTGGPGSANRELITNECGATNLLLSIAVYKDTLYFNTWTGQLKRFKIGVPGSGETLMEYGALFNSMTVDKNGVLYMASEGLFRYDPATHDVVGLGLMPFNSMGDLAFYKDKLLLAGYDPFDWSMGIYEININDLSASKLYMPTPSFFGLLSYPVACGKSRYFGLSSNGYGSTDLVEVDLDNKTVAGNAVQIPMDILDAASGTETGVDERVVITNLQINKLCQSATGSVNISATYPGAGNISYTLDNNSTNTTGAFTNIGAGLHSVRVSAPNNVCAMDTSFTIAPVYRLIDNVVKTNADFCTKVTGSITINASSPNGTISYTLLNSGLNQSTGNFTDLRGGRYDFRIRDAVGCLQDTTVALAENIPIGSCNDVFIPTAFTPNGDGKNELYTISLPTSFKNITLQIFGRWGNLVCQARGNQISWDGTYKGVQQPIGVYIYNLVYTDPSGSEKREKGTLTLIR
ncbi:MAG: gliding motility-associated C-terminal domain-containing protein [Bacteroidetes bacterium]|jgi:gliding motility-associated-like protein|nr:MAG: gliding motility-associated C-terminal domain-containing protein [Bacteroidota bacterium]